ncbi:protein O-glucosyltransferase 3 [Sinocyclocheilus grahami]|uniref:Glycosyl transferase CAP10 domain-containing protein n=1 Tax=Sinocyclocheilus grahami TaxID=75366 RepID=A0A672R2G5_SINGR|nr:PREDICTED: KDEL motif-containing protein 2 [Sinocyclocheilus grahami]
MVPHLQLRNARSSAPRVVLASLVAAVCVRVGFSGSAELDAGKCVVWGPGLSPAAVLPVRYFYIQSVDSEGRNISVSPAADSFRVKISSLEQQYVRVHVPAPLDRGDGSLLVRYRLYGSSSKGLQIEVLYQDRPVADSSRFSNSPVYHEYCVCPERDPRVWSSALQCPEQEPQIQQDFISFPSIDLQRLLQEVPQRFSRRGGLVHYSLINNQLHRRSLGQYTDFKMFSDEMLLSLARKVRLPDVEFYINVGDWPMENRKAGDKPGPVPIISWCGSSDTRDIILPTYDITHSCLEAMRGVTSDLLSVQGNTGPVWSDKTEKAFFRGRDSREERLRLVTMSKENPELLDAGITAYFFFRDREKDLGKAPLVGFFDFFKYKYQVNVDGTVAAYRFPYLMLGDSLVFKQDSPYYEHFYTHLEAGVHYIPVKRDLSDLLQKIRWAQKNDTKAEAIAKSGQSLVRDVLQPHRLYCYYYSVLQTYAARQSTRPAVHPDMELVPQPSDHSALCDCHRSPEEQKNEL